MAFLDIFTGVSLVSLEEGIACFHLTSLTRAMRMVRTSDCQTSAVPKSSQ